MRLFRIAMVQMNPTVGDVEGNVRQIRSWMREAQKAKADLVAFPELAITGYPPEDLLLKPQFLDENRRALEEVIGHCKNVTAVIGYVAKGELSKERVDRPMVVSAGGYDLFNAAAIIADQRLVTTYCKWYLPNYGVFDESRYFHSGHRVPLLLINGTCVGVNICEDIWLPKGPTKVQAAAGAEMIVNINASPFHVGKSRTREQMLATRAKANGVIVTYTNMVGGQDELVFDGNSVIVNQDGDVMMRGKAFQEDLLIADLDMDTVARSPLARKRAYTRNASAVVDRVIISKSYRARTRSRHVPKIVSALDPLTEVYQALVMGVHDYVAKNGFTRVVIGLSGGIDSALTAVIAVDALGAENVLGLFMPSPYTSRTSREDVAELARRLGVQVNTVSITRIFQSYLRSMADLFKGRRSDTTEENLQARIRGNLLMAVSNKFGHLVLTTGNKSEMSVGYATLYGDMAGGFAEIKDVPKTMVYQLTVRRNAMEDTPVIPQRILDRPPTAELKPDQTDQDTLPPYDVLDPILKAYVEEDRAPDDIVALGFDPKTVAQVIGLVDRSEYKRRQAPIGIKITHRAFGKDRRMPITNGYRSGRR
jgi:NAD+ synthase (glutamine-hydrolysing)